MYIICIDTYIWVHVICTRGHKEAKETNKQTNNLTSLSSRNFQPNYGEKIQNRIFKPEKYKYISTLCSFLSKHIPEFFSAFHQLSAPAETQKWLRIVNEFQFVSFTWKCLIPFTSHNGLIQQVGMAINSQIFKVHISMMHWYHCIKMGSTGGMRSSKEGLVSDIHRKFIKWQQYYLITR